MFWLLTLSTYALGGWLGWLAVRWHLRRRVSTGAVSRLGGIGVGILLTFALTGLLVPELPALLVLDAEAGAAGSDAMWLLRWLAVGVLGLAALGLLLSSRFVVTAVRQMIDWVFSRLPSWQGQRARRGFRIRLRDADPALAAFPTGWEELLAYDQDLSRRLLAYDHDLDLSVSYPVMRDYTEPQTRAALDAMFECDRLRTESAPWLTRDVIVTPYGAAVANFAELLVSAEAHAVELARVGLGEQERAGLAEAAKILQYVQTHGTTAPEREAAYRHIRELLDAQPQERADATVGAAYQNSTSPHSPEEMWTESYDTAGAGAVPAGAAGVADLNLGQVVPQPVGSQPHPWLDVPQRAALYR